VPVSEDAIRKAYQEAEQLRAALYDCVMQEGGGPLRHFLDMAYRTVDLVRLRLYDLIEEPPVEPAPIKRPSLVGLGRSREDVIQFRIPDVPPLYGSVDGRTRQEMRRYWAGRIVRLAREAGIAPRFRRASVSIFVAAPGRWDPDNRNLKPILDGLRRAQIIEDDDWRNVEIYLKGLHLPPGKEPYTDITVWGEDPQAPVEEVEEIFYAL